MVDGPFDAETGELTPRPPEKGDFLGLCRELNARECAYVIVGGFAVIQAGLPRTTGDIDILMDASLENERRVFEALATLPDGCVRELEPGDVAKYTVVRVADDVLVDLMASASGITYEEAVKDVVMHEIDGVAIPFASPGLLYRMKRRSGREKDRGDIYFLEQWFAAQGRPLPEV
ncbi:MAG: nucleotidyltransferase [Terrimicrobiaceae bacterium]|nr:nucleotidyltransferase [Terrimicrobiaceae bacterium]